MSLRRLVSTLGLVLLFIAPSMAQELLQVPNTEPVAEINAAPLNVFQLTTGEFNYTGLQQASITPAGSSLELAPPNSGVFSANPIDLWSTVSGVTSFYVPPPRTGWSVGDGTLLSTYNGSSSLFGSLGSETVPATVPAMTTTYTPPSVITGGFAPTPVSFFVGPIPALAGNRPDFAYNAGSLNFNELTSNNTTGQLDMGLAPGVPAGTKRYVPIGEF